MSDEAFARRFYSDRAELTALGVPLQSQRDEFTGEELYTLRSENYFLDRLELDDDELAALQTALYYLEGKFAYAEPLRLALQNLALGRVRVPRAADGDRRARSGERARLLAGARRAAVEARVRDLEAAHRPVRLLEPTPPTARRARRQSRMRFASTTATGTSSGTTSTATRSRTFKVSRIRGDIRFATRRERDFRMPADFDVEQHRIPRPWQIGEPVGTRTDRGLRRHGVVGRAHARRRGLRRGRRLRDRVRAGRAARRLGPAPERTSRAARARRASRRGRRGARPPRRGARRDRLRNLPARSAATRASPLPERPAGPVAPERFGVLQALLAHLLAACGEEKLGDALDAAELAGELLDPARGAPGPPLPAQPRQLRRRLLRRVRGARRQRRARRQGALRRRLPPAAEAHAARGPRDPARDRVRRARRSPPTRTSSSRGCGRSSRRRSGASISTRRPQPRAPRPRRRS